MEIHRPRAMKTSSLRLQNLVQQNTVSSLHGEESIDVMLCPKGEVSKYNNKDI